MNTKPKNNKLSQTEEIKNTKKREKIDIIMLKYAFGGRRHMLDMVNRGVRSDFFGEGADNMFRTLFDLFSDPSVAAVVSRETFVDHCNRIGKAEVAALAPDIFRKMDIVAAADQDYTYFLKEFRDRHNRDVARHNIEILATAMDANLDTEEINDLFRKSWNSIAALNRIEVFDEGTLGADMTNMRLEYEAVEQNKHSFRGVTVGIAGLDAITNGFQPGELIVVAGMEGTGKSLVMMNMAVNAWLGTNAPGKDILPTGKNVLYFTLEMPRSNRGRHGTAAYLNRRVLSCVSELPFSPMRKGELDADGRSKMMQTMEFVREYDKHFKFYVIDIPRGATVEDIEIKFQELNEQFPIDMVVVDYMGIMASSKSKAGDESDWEAQGHIAEGLHEFARTCAVPVVTGAQLNRPQGKNNSLKDQSYNNTRISRSGMITQNANIVMLIGCRDQEENYPDMPLYLTKMRDGTKGMLTLIKGFDRMRVYDAPPRISAASELDRFETLAPPSIATPAPPPSMDDYELSTSPVLDYGEPAEEDYSDADF